MTSRNSFSVSIRENQKRRIWAWAVSILLQIATYPGIMIIYLSRINARFNGNYDDSKYKELLRGAATDAVGFQPLATIPILVLGIILAIQGFSYLYDRKKVDMYHSVPVSMKNRFFVVYCNGIFIYLAPAILCNILAWLIAAAQGAFSLEGLAECGMAFVGNFLYFLVVYHTTILAVMLTGNVIITACAAGVLLSVDWWIMVIGSDLKDRFYEHADTYFFNDGINAKFCVVIDYLGKINELKRTVGIGKMFSSAAVVYAKWIALAMIPFVLAYFCYIKRPAEAAGNAIAFRPVKPFVKIIVSVIVGLVAYILIEEVTYENKPIAVICMIVGTVLCCALMEVIYDFDVRSAFKHLVSSGIAAVIVLVIFCIHQFDLFGYDAYIPDADKVESAAISMGSYSRYFEWPEEDEYTDSIYDATYLEDNMFITDVDAVCELARRSYEAVETEDMKELRDVNVLYRLKSGKTVSRHFTVDVGAPENEELLNRLIGSDEYKEGYYQIYQDDLPFDKYRKLMVISYHNGVTEWGISASCAEDVREAWIKDMEQFDFSLARNNRVCGYIKFGVTSSYTAWDLPVYESFTNTFALLEEQNIYYPLELRAEDIQSLEIVNYHYDEREDYDAMLRSNDPAVLMAIGSGEYDEPYVVTASFDDPEEIEQILAGIYPMELKDKASYWNNRDMTDRNYEITISFNADTDYHHPLGRGYYDFYFLAGEVPEFVVERTASTPVE